MRTVRRFTRLAVTPGHTPHAVVDGTARKSRLETQSGQGRNSKAAHPAARASTAVIGQSVVTESLQVDVEFKSCQPNRYNLLILFMFLVAGEGLEPPTPGL